MGGGERTGGARAGGRREGCGRESGGRPKRGCGRESGGKPKRGCGPRTAGAGRGARGPPLRPSPPSSHPLRDPSRSPFRNHSADGGGARGPCTIVSASLASVIVNSIASLFALFRSRGVRGRARAREGVGGGVGRERQTLVTRRVPSSARAHASLRFRALRCFALASRPTRSAWAFVRGRVRPGFFGRVRLPPVGRSGRPLASTPSGMRASRAHQLLAGRGG